jgi:hypothetical protein
MHKNRRLAQSINTGPNSNFRRSGNHRTRLTVRRQRKRSCVSRPDISTSPASSRLRKVLPCACFCCWLSSSWHLLLTTNRDAASPAASAQASSSSVLVIRSTDQSFINDLGLDGRGKLLLARARATASAAGARLPVAIDAVACRR